MSGLSDAISSYHSVCRFPVVTGGHLNALQQTSTSVKGSATLYLKQRNVVAGEFESHHITAHFELASNDLELSFVGQPTCVENTSLSCVSPSGNKQIVIRKGSANQQLMLYWNHQQLECTVDLKALGMHQHIVERAPHFYGCSWSSDERYFFYLAEKLRPRSCSFFDPNLTAKLGSGLVPGVEYVRADNWGEGFTDVSKTVVCFFDTVTNKLDLLPYDGGDELCIRTVIVDPARPDVLYCLAYHEKPFHLGPAWITQRACSLLRLTNWTNKDHLIVETLVSGSISILGAAISPDGSRLVWLQCPAGGPHNRAFNLWRIQLGGDNQKPTLVTTHPLFISSVGSPFVRSCWLSDNETILLTSVCKSVWVVLSINTSNGVVQKMSPDCLSSFMLLDVSGGIVLLVESSVTTPVGIALGKHFTGGDNFLWERRSLFPSPNNIDDAISWSIQSTTFAEYECQYISLIPKQASSKLPMIAFIHGGPHSAFNTFFPGYIEEATTFALSGYAVILVNYCGSLSFESLEALPGKISQLEVQSAHQCVQHALSSCDDRVDSSRVFIVSDSFGGFVTLHLVSQFPDFYRAAVCRNPVADIALMGHIADCPDWAFVEAGFCPSLEGFPNYVNLLNVDVATRMNEVSPMRGISKVKSPLLFALGRNDMRVPMQIALSYIRMMKQANPTVPIETHVYGDGHLILSVKGHADLFMKTIQFFQKHS